MSAFISIYLLHISKCTSDWILSRKQVLQTQIKLLPRVQSDLGPYWLQYTGYLPCKNLSNRDGRRQKSWVEGNDILVLFNPFKQNGIFHYYQLDQSVSVLLVVGWYFSIFIQFLITTFRKQTVENLIRCYILWHLTWGLHCLSMSHKNDARFIWINQLSISWGKMHPRATLHP